MSEPIPITLSTAATKGSALFTLDNRTYNTGAYIDIPERIANPKICERCGAPLKDRNTSMKCEYCDTIYK